ncbi:MAG: hypothetical protein AAGF92_23055 [Myxococcota bacterium]
MGCTWAAQLLEAGLVTEAQLHTSGAESEDATSIDVIRALVSSGLDERALAGFFVSLGFGPMLQARELARADVTLAGKLSGRDAHDHCALPLRPSPAGAVVAMADPTDTGAVARLEDVLGGPVLPTVARFSDLLDALDALYPGDRPTIVSDALSSVRGQNPSGVVPLVQGKPAEAAAVTATDRTLPSLDPKLAGLAHTASSVWDRAWDRTTGVGTAVPPMPAVTAPPSQPVPGPNLSELARVTSRDDAVRVACQACLSAASGSAFLALRKGVFRGWDGAGPNITSASIRSLWVPATNPSVLSEVAHSGKPYRGPHGQTAADHLLRAALGSQGRDLLIAPVFIGSRMCGLLCATDPSPDTDVIDQVAEAMGRAFQRLIATRKASEPPPAG